MIEADNQSEESNAEFSGQTLSNQLLEIAPVASSVEAEKLSDVLRNNEALEAFVTERAAEAVRSCEFEATPELQTAVESYYREHYQLAAAVQAIAEGRYDSEVLSTIVNDPQIPDWERRLAVPSQAIYHRSDGVAIPTSSANTRIAALRLANLAQQSELPAGDTTHSDERAVLLLAAATAMREQLFCETSVGISTLEPADIERAKAVAMQLRGAARKLPDYGLASWDLSEFPDDEVTESIIKNATRMFWADTREAGQLEFHGTSTIGDINVDGLMSRNEQYRRNGHMATQTAIHDGGGSVMHSVVPHFSEFYGRGQYAGGKEVGTLAVPLYSIIKEARYARDAEYGLLRPKEPLAWGKIGRPTLAKPIGSSGTGSPDYADSDNRDRVFFASPDEDGDKLPDAYVVAMGSKERKPATYIIDENLTEHHRDLSYRLLGLGYGLPERVLIPRTEGSGEYATAEEIEAEMGSIIRKLQQDYFEAYSKYGAVVPLRRGVFAQILEGMPVKKEAGRRPATKYNAYTPGSEHKAV